MDGETVNLNSMLHHKNVPTSFSGSLQVHEVYDKPHMAQNLRF